jgi:hypothetical protein
MSLNSNWKIFERSVAKVFGTKRTPLSGGNSGHSRSDSLHADFFISCKYAQASAIHTLYDEENPKAVAEEKIPVLCLKRARTKHFLIAVLSTDLLEFCTLFLRSKGYIVKKRK